MTKMAVHLGKNLSQNYSESSVAEPVRCGDMKPQTAYEDFDFVRVIGKGSYGEVWLAKHKKDKKQYVLKKMNLGKTNKKESKSAEQEAKLLSRLKHPNIVSYKDSFESSGFLYIAMQYCEGGDLYTKLKEQKGVLLEESQVVEWFVQIAMALQYMHERNILHRDLKTQNIFLTRSKIIKVGDLGIARILESATSMATTLIGTPYYMSPELFSNKPYNHKSDVWALGCCVYEMTTLKHAFNAKDMNSLVYKILKGRMPQMPSQYSPELLMLIRSMLYQDPEKRPSVNRILRDPYIKTNIARFLEDTKRNCLSSRQNNRPSSSPATTSASRPGSAPSKERVHSLPDLPAVSPTVHSARLDMGSQKTKDTTEGKSLPAQNSPPNSNEAIKLPSQGVSLPNGVSVDSPVTAALPQRESSPKKNPPRKKNFLQNRAKSRQTEVKEVDSPDGYSSERPTKEMPAAILRDEDTDKVSSISQVPKEETQFRPLPVPKIKPSLSLSLHREDKHVASSEVSRSSGMSDSFEDTEMKQSLPNLSARQRRRQQKNDSADSKESLNSARIKLRQAPVKTDSVRIMHPKKQEVGEEPETPKLTPTRQLSVTDGTSSSDESQRLTIKQDLVERENKEIKNFISVLDTTLKMNNTTDEEEELVPVRLESPSAHSMAPPKPAQDKQQQEQQQQITSDISFMSSHVSVSMPSIETLTDSSRLMDRIRMLHKDCIKGVGYPALRKAFDILEKIDEEEVEPKLVNLLGKDKFDEYAGKIWQLKFCEESLFDVR